MRQQIEEGEGVIAGGDAMGPAAPGGYFGKGKDQYDDDLVMEDEADNMELDPDTAKTVEEGLAEGEVSG